MAIGARGPFGDPFDAAERARLLAVGDAIGRTFETVPVGATPAALSLLAQQLDVRLGRGAAPSADGASSRPRVRPRAAARPPSRPRGAPGRGSGGS
jgi:hypothetical protein